MALCENCEKNDSDPTYDLPLCQQCRQILIYRPYPAWIKMLMVVVGIMMLFSVAKLPKAFSASNSQKSAKTAEEQSDYATAAQHYQEILDKFPNSEKHKIRLARCYLLSGNLPNARMAFEKIRTRKLSNSQKMEYELVSKILK